MNDIEAEATLSIGDVAAATGISTETLRIWERRYGRPRPHRLPSGHRRFTMDQLRWLRQVAEALARGMRPGRVLKLPDEELHALLEATEHGAQERRDLQNWMQLALAFRGPELRRGLALHWSPDDPLAFIEQHIAPFMRKVGRAWADGQIEIRHEHFISEVVEDLLRGLRAELPRSEDGPLIVLTTLPGEYHGLGVQMCALVCAAAGCRVRSLGTNSPIGEIVRSVNEVGASLAGISVSLSTGGVQTDRTLAELRALLPGHVHLVVGGAGARGIRRGPRGVTYLSEMADLKTICEEAAKSRP